MSADSIIFPTSTGSSKRRRLALLKNFVRTTGKRRSWFKVRTSLPLVVRKLSGDVLSGGLCHRLVTVVPSRCHSCDRPVAYPGTELVCRVIILQPIFQPIVSSPYYRCNTHPLPLPTDLKRRAKFDEKTISFKIFRCSLFLYAVCTFFAGC